MAVLYEIKINDPENTYFKKWRSHFHGPTQNGSYFITEKTLSHIKPFISAQTLKTLNIENLNIPLVQSFPAVLMHAPTEEAKQEVFAYALAQNTIKNPALVYIGRNIDLTAFPGAFNLDIIEGKRQYAWKVVEKEKSLENFSIERNFQKIKERILDKDTKVVLALSGGGLKMLSHTTLLQFLNMLGVYDKIEEIWGTSGGAIAGLAYAAKIHPHRIQEHGYGLYNHLFSLRLSPSPFEVLRNLFINFCIPKRWRPSGFSGFINCAKSLQDFIDALRKGSPLQKPLFCIALNIETLKTEVLSSEQVRENIYNGKIYKVEDPIEAVIASASVPILFVPKMIRRNGLEVQYIDGGVEENMPMKSVYEKWVIDRKAGLEKRKKLLIISSSLSNEQLNLLNTKDLTESDLLRITLNLLFEEIERSHRLILKQDPNVEVWEFRNALTDYSSFDVKFIPEFIKCGYQVVAKKAVEIEKHLEIAIKKAA